MTVSAIGQNIDDFLVELAIVADGRDRAEVLSAVAVSVGATPDPALGLPAAGIPEPPPDCDPADLIGLALQAITDAKTRTSAGLFYTPRSIADSLVVEAFRGQPVDGSVCDPTCGGGAFLLAAARWASSRGVERNEAVARLRGIDIDPVAAAACRTALGCWAAVPPESVDVVAGDGFAAHTIFGDGGPPFEAVIGNPPFQSQLGEATARTAEQTAALRQRFGNAVRPYADTGALFMLDALDLVSPGGVVAMVLPLSVLATRDLEPLRRIVADRSALRSVWIDAEAGFDAVVNVCAIAVTVGGSASDVRRLEGRVPVFETEVALPEPPWQWSEFAADRIGVPRIAVRSEHTVADIATATAGFRDEYYALAAAVVEGVDDDSRPRLVTSGLVEPLECRWGLDEARFAKTKWRFPVVDQARFDQQPQRLRRWLENRLVPKLLVATQTRTIEAMPDPQGRFVPVTPVISVEVDPGELWKAAAVLTNPVTSVIALRRTAGSALSARALKLSAKQLLELPLPKSDKLWEEGAMLAEAIAKLPAEDPELAMVELVTELGKVMCGAYGVDRSAVFAWWAKSIGLAGNGRENSGTKGAHWL